MLQRPASVHGTSIKHVRFYDDDIRMDSLTDGVWPGGTITFQVHESVLNYGDGVSRTVRRFLQLLCRIVGVTTETLVEHATIELLHRLWCVLDKKMARLLPDIILSARLWCQTVVCQRNDHCSPSHHRDYPSGLEHPQFVFFR